MIPIGGWFITGGKLAKKGVDALPRGTTFDIPPGWVSREADNGRKIVFQRPGATRVEIDDFRTEQLRASPELLKATLLRHGWDPYFNPDDFCTSDLFVVSV